MNTKPLGGKSYGSIPHLPGSRRGEGDHGLEPAQAIRLLTSRKDRHDRVIVEEKLDGSNVAVARVNGDLVAITRSGFTAASSPFEQHHAFDRWVTANASMFDALLNDGERVCGEWLAVAHGTRYDLTGRSPFVAFDIRRGHGRVPRDLFWTRCHHVGLTVAGVISDGPPMSIDAMLAALEPSRHGALDAVEGAVWRLEYRGEPLIIAKYVRSDKVDGRYLASVTGEGDVWNEPKVML